MASELKKETIIYRSGINLSGNEVMTIKKSNFKVIDISVGGDAPKDVVKIYQYNGKMRKAKPKTWPNYIVKIGQKWYPNESITEQLLSELGKTDRKSTRLNSSHVRISYAVFCLKKKIY